MTNQSNYIPEEIQILGNTNSLEIPAPQIRDILGKIEIKKGSIFLIHKN